MLSTIRLCPNLRPVIRLHFGSEDLDLPMSTTQLATALALSAPTLSAHLHALHRAGILTSRRDGRAVRYSRTLLGDHLLASAAEPA